MQFQKIGKFLATGVVHLHYVYLGIVVVGLPRLTESRQSEQVVYLVLGRFL